YLSEYCMTPCDPDFPKRAKENGGGFIVGGSNYGQGSSREHAALVPLYLGVRGVVAKSFARIHMANLINSGILPMTFADEADYDMIKDGDVLVLENAREQIMAGDELTLVNKTSGIEIKVKIALSDRQKEIMLAGGLLNYTKKQGQQ
ncbi:MAG TPA: aconitate hydratase, partial [Clostridiales bacterium]|nr:aconitate hydratase [Clostridiales bacterium]